MERQNAENRSEVKDFALSAKSAESNLLRGLGDMLGILCLHDEEFIELQQRQNQRKSTS